MRCLLFDHRVTGYVDNHVKGLLKLPISCRVIFFYTVADILERRLPNSSTELPDVGSVDAVESRKV